MIKVTILSTGPGVCGLTQKEGEGLTVSFENEQPYFLSWRSFRQLLALRSNQEKPHPKPTTPANGPVAVPKPG